ncbi:hypothetical protein [Flavihumibacter profundi]|uniref:hypothetical protein n=1 Tax=Flavihumibacter profundi TaxID=2716883 RepID=UPI001CC3F45B|nr:hypothetical protein [Flavihumibacter profundi]MBZ5858933.1 hypothetical protein [Flavihumibacter profundi]
MKFGDLLKASLLPSLVLVCSLLHAQQFDSALMKLESNFPQEKLYLHFDKNAYNPGETIWTKSYILVGNSVSNISKNVYSELLDQQGKLIQRKITPIILSGSAASFELPTNLTDSIVYVRAYTNWMLNFDTAFLFVKAIPIITDKKINAAKPALVPTTFLHFFPEGGDLVESVGSAVAFKANDARGLPVKISGDILNSKGVKVGSFASEHDGMGKFPFTPEPGEQYKAVWKDQAGKPQQTNLPAAKNNGVVLSISQVPDGIQFILKRREDATGQFPVLHIVAQEQQQIVYQAKANLTKSSAVRSIIPTENIPTGILQVTIFDENKRPLAERIVFVNHQDYYFITDLNVQLKSLEKRGKNVLQVDVPDTLTCNLSMAITDLGLNPVQPGESDIFSHLLLTSDIKGYVHNPGYYFSSDADSVAKHLDLVMMTNGWRRFKWEDILAEKWPAISHMPDNYITLEGNISGLIKSELVNQELSGFLNLKNGGQQMINIPVQRDGKFYIPGLYYYDTAKIYYQFNNDKNKLLTTKAVIDIKNNFMLNSGPFYPDPLSVYQVNRPDNQAALRNKNIAKKNIEVIEGERKVQTLANVDVVAKQKSKKAKMDEQYASGFFSGGDAYTFILEDDPSAQGSLSVLEYLQGKVAGLQITGSGTQMSMSWRGATPSLFLNEMSGDVSLIQNLSMSDVAMVKVFRPPFFGAPGGGSGGAIAVYSKKGGRMNNDKVKGLNFSKIPGYAPEKQFYSPDYLSLDTDRSQDDLRTTLYWNPTIYTDKNNRRLYFTFFNNDVAKKYRIIIEGVNTEGKLTRIEKIVGQ